MRTRQVMSNERKAAIIRYLFEWYHIFIFSVSSNVSIELRMGKIDVFSPRLGSLPCNVCQPTTGHGKEDPIKEKHRPENTLLTIIRPVNSHGKIKLLNLKPVVDRSFHCYHSFPHLFTRTYYVNKIILNKHKIKHLYL